MNPSATPSTGGGIKEVLTADPRKSVALAVLLVVLGIVGWRMFAKSGPSPANASATSGPLIPLKKAGTDNSPSRGRAHSGKALVEMVQGAHRPLGRNLFVLRPDAFTLKWGLSETGSEPGAFWTQLAKSMSLETDLKSRRQGIVDAIIADAGKLRLSSTMMGVKPQAIINDQLVEEGAVVASFRVLKIGSRGITVEREGIRLEIQMK